MPPRSDPIDGALPSRSVGVLLDRRSSVMAWESSLFWIVLALYAVFPLTLSVFPNEDGPAHIYYAEVFRDILLGGGNFRGYFDVKPLAPYTLAYYLVGLLRLALSPALAEKLFVSAYVVAVGLAFRYFVRGISPRATSLSVVIFPFVLNKFVYLGFASFTTGSAITLLLCGFWLRPSSARAAHLLWALILVAAILAHPIALLAALVFMGMYLCTAVSITVGRSDAVWGQRLRAALTGYRTQIVWMLAALSVSAYVLTFADPTEPLRFPTLADALKKCGKVLVMGPLSPFQLWYYALTLGIQIYGVCAFAIIAALRKGCRSVSTISILASGIACVVCYILMPESVSGAWAFDQRFALFGVWFCLAAAVSSAAVNESYWRPHIVGASAVISLSLLCWQVSMCSQNQFAVDLFRLPTVPANSRGESYVSSTRPPSGFAFVPLAHAGGYYFARSRAVFLNPPWRGLTFLPVTPRASMSSVSTGITIPDFALLIGTVEDLGPGSRLTELMKTHGFRVKHRLGRVSILTPGGK